VEIIFDGQKKKSDFSLMRKVLGFKHSEDVFSAGSNATTRVHHASRRCGGLAAHCARSRL
jgi:hypothetical protein